MLSVSNRVGHRPPKAASADIDRGAEQVRKDLHAATTKDAGDQLWLTPASNFAEGYGRMQP